LVWIKSKATNFLNAKKQPLRRHEDICVFYPKQPTYNPVMSEGKEYDKGIRKNQLTGSYGDFNPIRVKSKGGRYPTDVIYCKTAESEGVVWHSTQKPVELGRYLIRTYTNPGDVILDNASGSGSFVVAAIMEDRKAIGIEINKGIEAFKMEPVDLIEITEMRLRKHISGDRIFVIRSGQIGINALCHHVHNFLRNFNF
jgi:site-specific DNA-methyltransferase (adenine-specific)